MSLFEAIFVLPAHLAHSRAANPDGRFHQWQQRFSKKFLAWVDKRYSPIVHLAVRFRYVSLAIGVALLVLVLAWPVSGRMGFELFPTVESDRSEVRAVLPLGSPQNRVEAVANQLTRTAQEIVAKHGGEQLSTGIYTSINENTVSVRTYLTDPDIRPLQTSEFTDLWRQRTGSIAGVDSMRFAADSGGPAPDQALPSN
ncbi:MAG: efflux RND transporter permease subunit [Limnobacter sp.]|nr:efflux RND transporter permease subunit [Limnobacter sp.]